MRYVFYIEGLDREAEEFGLSEKQARDRLWRKLSDEERDRVVQIECIEEMEVGGII